MTSNTFETALDGLGAFREADLIVVPVAPTKAMIDIGASTGGIDLETTRIIYEAMINVHFLNPIED